MLSNNNVRRPDWLKVKLPSGENFRYVRNIVRKYRLHTVCESAGCPNLGECWNRRTATFMILGNLCTRNCRFCAVPNCVDGFHSVRDGPVLFVDRKEPERVALAVKQLKLKYVVVTSVTRDDLIDGGASIFAETIRQIRFQVPDCRVEVLIPDFRGSKEALNLVLDAQPDVLNHNVETVPRLYPTARPQANYQRSLAVLENSKKHGAVTKSGLMVGLGETKEEILAVMRDLRGVRCDFLTIGQYLQPTQKCLPVERFVSPEEFAELKQEGLRLQFRHVESAPLVRSSYHADEQLISAL
ncbi:lipoyl synthase [candidate division KSB1 bacterium]|nr:MAG: lipoyl synthase [candidate division KSB1 bacterium 4484_219]RKY78144.1 MAG: lipoyl synthase [candidate division KSB1 bacterium]RKY82653.1 MAG: lipoyl synthase [candidate division KSB1 bacterium]RKY88736.1 MAG: lipoyl synthase [candidate division KSB1 bacterium]HDI52259.1 lipoyl synthase [Bacteroidota bacterium]